LPVESGPLERTFGLDAEQDAFYGRRELIHANIAKQSCSALLAGPAHQPRDPPDDGAHKPPQTMQDWLPPIDRLVADSSVAQRFAASHSSGIGDPEQTP
jgi:hypothetical protein